MMDKQRVVKILVDARELVRTKWVWGGQGVAPKSGCYCALGAIAKADDFPKMYAMDILRLALPPEQREPTSSLRDLRYQSSPELCAAAKLLEAVVPAEYRERVFRNPEPTSLGLVWGYNDSPSVRENFALRSGAAPKAIIEWFDAAVAAAEVMA